MSRILRPTNILRLGLTLITLPYFVACGPHDKPNPHSSTDLTSIKLFSPETLNCEAKIRQQMVQRNIGFASLSELSQDIDKANSFIVDKTLTPQYQMSQNPMITALTVNFNKSANNISSEMSYSISPPVKDEGIMVLMLSYSTLQSDSSYNLTQIFYIDKDCVASLSSTSRDTIKKTALADNYVSQADDYFANGQPPTNLTTPFSLPKDGVLYDLTIDKQMTLAEMAKIPTKGYSFEGEHGIDEVTISALDQIDETDWGLTVKAKGYRMTSLNPDHPVVTDTYIDESAGVTKVIDSKFKNSILWAVPEKVWSRQLLGAIDGAKK